jgi:hypothetical protein
VIRERRKLSGRMRSKGIAVYLETEDDADAFALEAGLLGHDAGP